MKSFRKTVNNNITFVTLDSTYVWKGVKKEQFMYVRRDEAIVGVHYKPEEGVIIELNNAKEISIDYLDPKKSDLHIYL